ncbi:unnamed protein product [Cyclocybe aegerita]|uniref:Uncharacterized protein n=1 Tax=Cyclocybe aegerita TaxID=1973307 RepID=A0A8S0WAW2_CYCAE|nr:unnamed protein product [Cyclocybe aegerita]
MPRAERLCVDPEWLEAVPLQLRCAYSLQSLERVYLEELKRLEIHLEPFDCDFSAFQAPAAGTTPSALDIEDFPEALQELDAVSGCEEGACSAVEDKEEGYPPRWSLLLPRPTTSRPPEAALGSVPKKRSQRGKGSSKRRPRRGRVLKKAEGNVKEVQRLTLHRRLQSTSAFVQSDGFSLEANGLAASTGWHGRLPSLQDRELVSRAYDDGSITEYVKHFYPVYYNRAQERPALLLDSEDRAFAYRTTVLPWLREADEALWQAIQLLLGSELESEDTIARCAKGVHL